MHRINDCILYRVKLAKVKETIDSSVTPVSLVMRFPSPQDDALSACWPYSVFETGLCVLQGSGIVAENCHNSNGVFQGHMYHSQNTDSILYDPQLL